MSKCKAVIFDLDGILLDSERVALGRWRQVAHEMGLGEIEKVYARCVGTNPAMTRQLLQEAYGPDLSAEAFFERLLSHFPRTDLPQMPVKPGAREILEALRDRPVTLALASSSPLPYIRRELGGAQLLDFFDHVVSGDMVRRSKPDPEIFLKAAALCGAAPEETWVVEDSFNGIRAAHSAGMHPVMVPDLLPPDGEMEQKAERILPDLLSARDYLLELLA